MIHMRALVIASLVFTIPPAMGAPPPSPAPVPAQPAEDPGGEANAIVGKWKLADPEVVVEIARSGAGYAGTVVESPKGPAMVGKVFLRGVSYDAAQGTWRGEIYAPKREEYVPMTAKRKGAGVLVMTAGKGLMTKELTWNRL